jgi:hypothetical protein
MIIAVVERNYSVANPDFRDRYIGSPCYSFDEARELCAAHLGYKNELHVVDYIDNGVHYAEIDHETGEILKEFFVRTIG